MRRFTKYPSNYVKANTSPEYETGGKNFEGYMGAVGWEGRNSNLNLDIKEIAKIVRTQFRNKFPGYKINARIKRYSGGQSMRVEILIPKTDLMSKEQFVSESIQNPWKYLKGSWGWIGYPNPDGSEGRERADILGDISKEERAEYFSRYYDHELERYTGNADIQVGSRPIPLLNDDALVYVKSLVDSFNYDDSNSMVDYFDVNFYGFIYYGYL